MSSGVNNAVDVDLFTEMQMQGDTEVQSRAVSQRPEIAFVQKCLHPPSALPGYQGIPTNDARSQVCLEWRRMNLNNTPYFFDQTTSKVRAVTPDDLGQFDYAFLHLNGCRVMSVPYIFNRSVNTMTQDLNNVQTINQYNWKSWASDANLHRMVYKSSTHTLNATAFNDTGIVVGNQFNPNILFHGSLTEMADIMPTNFRAFVKSMIRAGYVTTTTDPIDRERFNSFPRYIREDILEACNLKPGTILRLDPDVKIQVLNFSYSSMNQFPTAVPTNDSILQNSLRSYGGKALEGAFSIQRLNTIAPSWCAAANTVNMNDETIIPGLYFCYIFTLGGDGDAHFVPLHENAAVDDTPDKLKILQDTLWTKDMTMSWVKFSGLSLNPVATGSSYPSTQLMAIKQYVGIEVQPSPVSAWGAMMKLGPKPDLQSMQALMDGFFELKDVLPARYNFWGTLGSIAAQGLKTFGSSILENLMSSGGSKSKPSSKSAKPKKEMAEVRDVARKEDSLNKKVDQLLAALTKGIGNGMQISGKAKMRVNRSRRKQPGKRKNRSNPVVLPPGQSNQTNPPVVKPQRRTRSKSARRSA